VGRLEVLKALIVVAAFLAPIAVAAGVSEEPVLESPRTLAVALGAAWVVAALVGYGFYGGKRCIGAATLLVVTAVVVLVAYARPWVGEEENVMFWYAANFSYENSEDNLPIENVWLLLPYPNIDNEPADMWEFVWELRYNDENNVLQTQIRNGVMIRLLGNRTTSIIIQYGRTDTKYGPKLAIQVDKLYARESIGISTYVPTSSENADLLTLRESRENQMVSVSCLFFPSSKRIDISFKSLLSRKINDNFKKIEEFGRRIENADPSAYWLYRIENNSI